MAIPRLRLTPRTSIQLTAELIVPTMRRATTSTRKTGQNRSSNYRQATTRTRWSIVAGDTHHARFLFRGGQSLEGRRNTERLGSALRLYVLFRRVSVGASGVRSSRPESTRLPATARSRLYTSPRRRGRRDSAQGL
jgi:hypothetical protein